MGQLRRRNAQDRSRSIGDTRYRDAPSGRQLVMTCISQGCNTWDGALRRRERARRAVVTLVFVVYSLLIVEGALRKWLFPAQNEILYFARDPFTLAIYVIAVRYRLIRVTPLLRGLIGLGAACGAVVAIQTVVAGVDPLIVAYGWRNYFYYAPLTYVIASCFREDDIRRLLRISILICIPMAALVYWQFVSPPDSFINKNVVADTFVFRVTGDIVRTTGTFSFTAGYALFVGSIVAMMTVVWMRAGPVRVISPLLLILASLAALTMIALSGSRTVFLIIGAEFVAALMASIVDVRPDNPGQSGTPRNRDAGGGHVGNDASVSGGVGCHVSAPRGGSSSRRRDLGPGRCARSTSS